LLLTERGAGHVPLIAKKIAELKHVSVEDVYTAARANTRRMYGIYVMDRSAWTHSFKYADTNTAHRSVGARTGARSEPARSRS